MKIQCDVCEKKQAVVLCPADEAALCEGCDHRVHHANKLSSKHLRFSLIPNAKEAPQCDICQERRSLVFCREDRAILCSECDISKHMGNEHARKHNRFLLTSIKLSASSSAYPTSSSSSSGYRSANYDAEITISDPSIDRAVEVSNAEMFSQTSNSNSVTTPSTTYQIGEQGSISISNTPGLFTEMPPSVLHFEDFPSSASHPIYKSFDYNLPIFDQQGEINVAGSVPFGELKMWAPQGPCLPSDFPIFFPTI
ncbi:hypothetical protein Nepgr_018111 [Nepenthes gracilis]|uniref:B box-type domain-containing protein n=1 Tax=Nepenthes gracilis TaxID=150966 RepID=A0AAD3SSS3_NEPGR|nr:hypothetical protein Nepgr_018111 [Nepenthes gracilis]